MAIVRWGRGGFKKERENELEKIGKQDKDQRLKSREAES